MIHLHYKHLGDGEPLIVLHGLFGSSDNWSTLGKRWSTDLSVYLADLRNHGRSPHTTGHSIPEMVQDVVQLLDELELEDAHLLGHSMGGKVVMELALQHPDRVRSLVVADMAPRKYPRGHDDILRALHAVDMSEMEKRSDIEARLSDFISQKSIVYFLAKNVARTKEGFRWKMNLEVLDRDYEKILQANSEDKSYNKKTLFLRGEKSDYIRAEDETLIRRLFPKAEIKTIPDAGHWLHAEQQDLFYEAVLNFIKDGAE